MECSTSDSSGLFQLRVPYTRDSVVVYLYHFRLGHYRVLLSPNEDKVQVVRWPVLYRVSPGMMVPRTPSVPQHLGSVGCYGGWGVAFPKWNFSPWANVLGTDFAGTLSDSLLGWRRADLHFLLKPWELGVGWNYAESNDRDKRERVVNASMWSLGAGYAVFSWRGFRLVPYMGLQWWRWRLRSGEMALVSQYVAEKELDLRLHHFAMEGALKFAKVWSMSRMGWDSDLQVQVFASRPLPLHGTSIARSATGRLNGAYKEVPQGLMWGMSFSFLIQ